MKILVVGLDPFEMDSGPTIYLRNLLDDIELHRQCSITMLSLGAEATRRAATRRGVTRYFLREPPVFKTVLSPLLLRQEVKRIVEEVKPDVIDLHFPERAELVSGLQVPIVVTIHGLIPELLKHGLIERHKAFLKAIYRQKWWKGISLANHAICLCDHDVEYLKRYCATPTSVIAVPRSKKYFVPKDRDADGILSVGTITPRKNQLALLRAAALLGQRMPHLRVRLIGAPATRADNEYLLVLNRFIAENGLEKNVSIESVSNDHAIEEQRRAAVYIQVSNQETFPGAVVEALAAGTPAVVHDIPGLRETIVDGVTGFLVPSNNASALAARIQELLEQLPLRHRMGEAAKNYAKENFLSRIIVEKRLALFERVCSGYR